MNMKEILDHLTYNELSQYSIGGYEGSEVSDLDLPKVMSIINEGVKDINSKVPFMQGIVVVKMIVGVHGYIMDKKFSTLGAQPGVVPYIMDSVYEPFPTNFRRFVRIFDEDRNAIPINVRNDPHSIAVPEWNKFQVPFARDLEFVEVEYLYDPENMVIDDIVEAVNIEYPLPYYTAAALYAYVSSKMTAGIPVQQRDQTKVMSMSKYDIEIKHLLADNHLPNDVVHWDRFHRNGFI